MADETPSPFWRKLVPKPSGTMPGGLFGQITVGLLAIMIGAMLVSYRWCGGEPAPAAPPETQPPVAGGAHLPRQLAGMTQQERREYERERAEQARREQQAQQEAVAAGMGGGRIYRDQADPLPPGAPGGGQSQFQTEGEVQLLERLRLEDIERRRRSLRVGAVVLSHRTGASAPAEENQEAPPSPAEPHAAGEGSRSELQAALRDIQSAVDEAGASEAGGAEAPAAAPAAAPAPPADAATGGYADPTRIAGPFDPAGWERLYEGSFLEAALVTQLSGEFTGPVLAQVSVPFYSADRQRVLVPRGTRAIGTAQAVGSADQTRLAVGFHRLVFPDGRWVELTFDGLDQAGDAALKDKVNRHYLSMFAAVGAIGVLSGLTLRGSHPYMGGAAGFRAGAGQAMGQSGMQILSRFLNRYPTITIRAGHRLRIWFTSDVLVPRPPPQGGDR